MLTHSKSCITKQGDEKQDQTVVILIRQVVVKWAVFFNKLKNK